MNQRLALAMAAVLVTVSAAVAAAGPLETREMRMQRQIHRGIVSGRITQAEALRLRAGQKMIRVELAEARRDGRMTPRERERIERQMQRQEMLIQRLQRNARQS